MILFVAPNPHKVKDKEGFLQRVAAIDKIFEGEERQYSSDFTGGRKLAAAIIQADLIYVHSVYNANKILRMYPDFADKIITDMHGIVPEEETLADNHEVARVMAETEEFVFRHGKTFVAVSGNMVKYFEEKYKNTKNKNWIVLPIFQKLSPKQNKKSLSKVRNIVYAGGGQSWQNVPLMVESINESSNDNTFTILSHSPESFDGINDTVKSRVTVKTVPSDKIESYYKKAVMGFVLRDDNPVNNVACPTKLIEYIAYGVVPIVLSANIGDFKSLGYTYVTLKDFKNGNVSDIEILDAVDNNYLVYNKYVELARNGEEQLRKQYQKLIKLPGVSEDKYLVDLIDERVKCQELKNKNIIYEYQIEVYKQKVSEYANAVEYYKDHLLKRGDGIKSPLSRLRHGRHG